MTTTTTTTTHETEILLLPAPLPHMEDREKVISEMKRQSDELEDVIKIEKEKLMWDEIIKEYQKEEQPEMALEEDMDELVLGFAAAADVVTYLLKAVANAVNDRLQRYLSGYACKFSKQVECQLYVKDEPTPVLKYKYLRLTQHTKKSEADGVRSIVFNFLAEMAIKNNVAIKIQPLRVHIVRNWSA